MRHYLLSENDTAQPGDEFFSNNQWNPIPASHVGMRVRWGSVPIRRLAGPAVENAEPEPPHDLPPLDTEFRAFLLRLLALPGKASFFTLTLSRWLKRTPDNDEMILLEIEHLESGGKISIPVNPNEAAGEIIGLLTKCWDWRILEHSAGFALEVLANALAYRVQITQPEK